MISYSDLVLAEKPWAYWPLNDVSVAHIYDENQYLIDVSGNNHHLSIDKDHLGSVIGQSVFVPGEILSFDTPPSLVPKDSLPIRGLKVLGSTLSTRTVQRESDRIRFFRDWGTFQ